MRVLKRERISKGMTQCELSASAGVDEARISKAENYGVVGSSQLEKLAAALGWQGKPDELLQEVR